MEASSVIGSNDYLIQLILLLLPVKTLLRFKSVSKQWKFIISDNRFAVKHSCKHNNNNPPCGIFICPDIPTRSFSESLILSVPLFGYTTTSIPPLSFLDKIPIDSDLRLLNIQSCNGLLLCSFLKSSDHHQLCCVVCNPTTRDFKVLPPSPTPNEDVAHRNCDFKGLALAFNPSRSHHYKVLAIKRFFTGPSTSNLHIYSLETNRWEIIPLSESFVITAYSVGVFANDTVYWVDETRMRMTYYNLNSDNFGRAQTREPVSFKAKYRLGVSCGRLSLGESYKSSSFHGQTFELNISEMRWCVVNPCASRTVIGLEFPDVKKGGKYADVVAYFRAPITRATILNLVLFSRYDYVGTFPSSLDVPYVFAYIPSLAPV